MPNRRIIFVASVMILCLAACYSQAIGVNDHVARSISSRQPTSPNQDDQQVVADDDSDSLDDFRLFHGNINRSLARVTVLNYVGDRTIFFPSCLSTSTTLEEQHILLRL
jgi:hypothetical protein